MKKLVLIAIILISCSTQYTRIGDKQKISEDKEPLSYDVSDISKPSPDSPYLRFTIEEKTRIIEKYKEKVNVKKSPNFLTFTPLLGVIPGFILRSTGYVGLGETVIGLSAVTVASTFGLIKASQEGTKWKITQKEHMKKTIPSDKKFGLLLEEENHSLEYTPDKSGKLEISMLDFASFYKSGKDFNFLLTSPQGKKLQKLQVETKDISTLLAEKKGITYVRSASVDVDKDIPIRGKSSPEDIAVIVGIRNYSNPDIPDVDYAINDAKVIKEYLKNALGYSEENIIYLQNPSKGELEAVFGTYSNPKGKLYNYVRAGKSDILVYYSGHGAPDIDDKKAYLVPYDGDPFYIEINGYPLEVLYENISKIPAEEKTVIIEACFSGNTHKGMLFDGISPLSVTPIGEKEYTGINIFSAGAAGEVAGWYPKNRHGLFTYFLLKGIRGEADKNQDHRITYGEMEDYLGENVPYYARRLYGSEQHPVFSGKRDKVFIRW
jgi:hypothetical protein